MSYGHPYYNQGAPPGTPGSAPYPQQPGYAPGQAPYPQQPSFPSPYPNPSYGNYGYPPNQMPQPYNMPMPDHSGNSGGTGGFPTYGGYQPPSQGGYPPAQPGGYPPQGGYFPPGSCPPGPNPAMNPAGNPPPQMSGGYQDYVPPPTQSSMYQTANVPHGPSSQHRPYSKGTPTVFPAEPFDPRADAETLRKAMKGFGTDEKAIIQVLSNRTNSQRLEIGIQFKTLYGKDLNKDLKSELSGRFEDLVMAMMMPLPQFYAKEVHDALSGIGTDEDTLIEVFCTMTNNELRTIRAAYEAMYGSCMEGDLSGDTSGTFRRLMVSLSTAQRRRFVGHIFPSTNLMKGKWDIVDVTETANRDESMMVDPTRVHQDAQQLLQAGELRLGTDESTFNAILCQRNYAHLAAVFQEYERITGHDMEQAIKNEFSGDAEEGLLAIVRSVKDKATFFAKRIHESMKGMGTNDRQLIRLVVTRSEVDMGEIKQAYMAKYGKSLEEAIKDDTSGDYKKCLVALIS